jgi:hypothetical protein
VSQASGMSPFLPTNYCRRKTCVTATPMSCPTQDLAVTGYDAALSCSSIADPTCASIGKTSVSSRSWKQRR